MLQQISTATLAAAAKAGITIVSYGVETFLVASKDEHMARVTFLMDGNEFDALEYFDRKSGQLTEIARHLDTKGIYDRTTDSFRLLTWHPMTEDERAAAEVLKTAIRSAMQDAIRESRRRPKKSA